MTSKTENKAPETTTEAPAPKVERSGNVRAFKAKRNAVPFWMLPD